MPLVFRGRYIPNPRIALAMLAMLSAAGSQAQELRLVPFPKSCEPGSGRLVLNAECRIVAADESLVAAGQSGKRGDAAACSARSAAWPAMAQKAARLRSKSTSNSSGEAYELEVSDRAVVKGGSYKGVVWGLVTLLQSANADNGKVVVPQMKIADQPYAEYRGLSVDLARRWHPIETVKQAVVLAHWYKIGYLQLHLSDNESWTFPSTAYPKLATPGRQYTLDQLRDLESFAAARGVTIVPSLEMPGHSGAAGQRAADAGRRRSARARHRRHLSRPANPRTSSPIRLSAKSATCSDRRPTTTSAATKWTNPPGPSANIASTIASSTASKATKNCIGTSSSA